jgi:hypothetical protein
MPWSFPSLLGGPVLYWELVRASRRPWLWILRYGLQSIKPRRNFHPATGLNDGGGFRLKPLAKWLAPSELAFL